MQGAPDKIKGIEIFYCIGVGENCFIFSLPSHALAALYHYYQDRNMLFKNACLVALFSCISEAPLFSIAFVLVWFALLSS